MTSLELRAALCLTHDSVSFFQATSPLPQDLGQLLCGLQLERVKVWQKLPQVVKQNLCMDQDACPVKGSSTFLSRRRAHGEEVVVLLQKHVNLMFQAACQFEGSLQVGSFSS